MFCHDTLATDLCNAEFSPLCCCLGYGPNLSPAWLSEGLFKVIHTSFRLHLHEHNTFTASAYQNGVFFASAEALRIFRVTGDCVCGKNIQLIYFCRIALIWQNWHHIYFLNILVSSACHQTPQKSPFFTFFLHLLLAPFFRKFCWDTQPWKSSLCDVTKGNTVTAQPTRCPFHPQGLARVIER